MKFVPIAKPSSTKSVKYEYRPKTLGQRVDLWGVEPQRTKAPSNIFTKLYSKWKYGG